MMRIPAVMALAAALLTGSDGREPVAVGSGRIDPVAVEAPASRAASLVVYFSDIPGWGRADSDVVAALVAAGAAVQGSESRLTGFDV
jgi:type IV secretory pathway VirJ component